jgi:DNA-directed RNA polymerase subunit RPC12/RpoP
MRNKKKRTEEKILEAITLAKEKGEILNSIDQLVCPHHSDATFLTDQISGSEHAKTIYQFLTRTNLDGTGLNSYTCSSCSSEHLPKPTTAYDCPRCGIVKDNFEWSGYSYGEGAAFSSGSGTDYLCRICETKIGESPIKIRR